MPAVQLTQITLFEFGSKYEPEEHARQGYVSGYAPGKGPLETERTTLLKKSAIYLYKKKEGGGG